MKKIRRIAALACVMALLTGCASEAPDRSKMPGLSYVPETVTAAPSKDIELVKDEPVVKTYPSRDVTSYYAEFLQNETGELHMPDYSEWLGAPFSIEGIWRVTDFDPASILYSGASAEVDKSVKSTLRKSGKVYTLETEIGNVLVLDIIDAVASIVKDSLKDDLVVLQRYKAIFENFKCYNDKPEEGEKASILGFYLGYDEDLEMPVMTYGISRLIRFSIFGEDYARFRSLKTRKAKFLNYIDFEIPAIWPDAMESSSQHDYFVPDATLSIFCEDDPYETTLKDTIDYFYDREFGEYAVDFNLQGDYCELPSGIPAYKATFTVPPEYGAMQTGMITAFLHKHKLVVLWLTINGHTVDTDLYAEDYEKIVDSITLRAY